MGGDKSKMKEKPPFIYKYKAVSTKEDLIRILDITNNHRIYMPNYKQLNDPLEGEIISISVESYAGVSLSYAADKEDTIVRQCKNGYRILSLTSEYNNPLLWAHYADAYKGVCLCFTTEDSLRSIQEIEYCSSREDLYASGERSLQNGVKKSFLKKNSKWSYEKEWRIIRKTKNNYLHIKNEELRGIIFGHNMSKEIIDFFLTNIDSRIVKMKTDIGYRTFQINVLPINYEYNWDGTHLRVLDVEKSLYKGKCIFRSRSLLDWGYHDEEV